MDSHSVRMDENNVNKAYNYIFLLMSVFNCLYYRIGSVVANTALIVFIFCITMIMVRITKALLLKMYFNLDYFLYIFTDWDPIAFSKYWFAIVISMILNKDDIKNIELIYLQLIATIIYLHGEVFSDQVIAKAWQCFEFGSLEYATYMAHKCLQEEIMPLYPENGINFEDWLRMCESAHNINIVNKVFLLLPSVLNCYPSLALAAEDYEFIQISAVDIPSKSHSRFDNSLYKIKEKNGNPPVYVVSYGILPLYDLYLIIHNDSAYRKHYETHKDLILFKFEQTLMELLEKYPKHKSLCKIIRLKDYETIRLGKLLLHHVKEVCGYP